MEKEYTPDDIQTLSAVQAVRLRPRLYFEKCFKEKNLNALPFEVLCHAFDEYFDGVRNTIEISLANENFTVTYNAGISLEKDEEGHSKAERMMTQVFACRNDKKHLSVGDEFCSLGMATINFASERCELTTICMGTKGDFVFEEGVTTSVIIEPAPGEKDFTKIFIHPDKAIFEDLTFTLEGAEEKKKEIMERLPGLNILIHNRMSSE